MGKLRRRRKGASPVVTSTRHFAFSSTTVDRRCGHGQSQRPTSQLSSSDAQNVRRPINSEPKRFSSVPTTAPHALRIEPPFKCLSFPDACREGTGGPLHSQVHTTLLTRQTLVRPRVVRKRANIPRCTFLKPPRPYQSLSQAPARLPASIRRPSIPPTCESNGAEPRRLARRLVTNRSSGGIYYRKAENDCSKFRQAWLPGHLCCSLPWIPSFAAQSFISLRSSSYNIKRHCKHPLGTSRLNEL